MTNTEKIIADFFVKREGEEILNHLHQFDFIESGYIVLHSLLPHTVHQS